MKGFDAEFVDLDHYIRVITARIWEGRQIDAIHRYYSTDCVVETPSGVTRGIEPVVQGTLETLVAFPDRRLLAEDILVAGDDTQGFLSSHRIISPMTHAGTGRFGPATGRPVRVRTIADCVCRDNRIVHEWLVRDQAAIARAIGSSPEALARQWLQAAGGSFTAPQPQPAPAPYVEPASADPIARALADLYAAIFESRALNAVAQRYDEAAQLAAPGGLIEVGHQAITQFWLGLSSSFPAARLSIDSLAVQRRADRHPLVAMRWRLQADHTGRGRYGEPTGKPVSLLGITHAEFAGEHIVREWTLIDDVAVWMQILSSGAR